MKKNKIRMGGKASHPMLTQDAKMMGKTQEEKPQVQIKINHEDGGDLMKKKKKTRRGGRARHSMLIQDAKMMSKNQDEKKVYAHIKCEDMGHFVSKCPTKLEKRLKQLMRGKAMRSNSRARKRRL